MTWTAQRSPGTPAWLGGHGSHQVGQDSNPAARNVTPQAGQPAPSGTSAPAGDSPARLDAKAQAAATLQSWGLPSSLADSVTTYLVGGGSLTGLPVFLQSTPEYKARFPANDKRIAAGLHPLTPSQYVAMEDGYRNVFRAYGLPTDFYANNSDFTNLITNDVSTSEADSRVKMASDLLNNADPAVRQQLQAYYGIDDGHLIAHFLDPQAAMPILQKQERASTVGSFAARQGLAVGVKDAEKYATDPTLSDGQIANGFNQVATVLPGEKAIADRFGQDYKQADAQDEFLGGLASAARKRRQLNQQEQSLFAGDSGTARGSFAQGSGQY